VGEQPFGQVAPFDSTSFDAVATVVLAAPALADLERLIVTHSLPATTRGRVRTSLEPLASFPLIGSRLVGRWQGFRFILGPWPWMLVVYDYDESIDQVGVVTIQDSRSARSATSSAKQGRGA
jgi:plasmid stabilization system protein ParE